MKSCNEYRRKQVIQIKPHRGFEEKILKEFNKNNHGCTALTDNPTSGSFYAPHGDGIRLKSLGIHEHWNNADKKKYSRNLEKGKGNEFVCL